MKDEHDIPLESEKLNELLSEMETEERVLNEPVSLTVTEFFKGLKSKGNGGDGNGGDSGRLDNLERLGCRFIKAAYVFMAILNVPSQARDFVIILMAISDGQYLQPLIITDETIALYSDISKPTIKKKRDVLWDWQVNNNCMIVEILEKDYDPAKLKFSPTQYRLILTPYIAEFVRRAETKELFRKPAPKVIEQAVETGMKEVVDEIATGLPESTLKRRRLFQKTKQKSFSDEGFKPSLRHAFVHPSENESLPAKERVRATREDLLRLFRGYCSLLTSVGMNVENELDELEAALREIAREFTDKHIVDEFDF